MKIVFEKLMNATGPEPFSYTFVEVEDNTGHSHNWGEWGDHRDGHHKVLAFDAAALITALGTQLLELEDRNSLERILASQTTPRAWQRLTLAELDALEKYRAVRRGDPLSTGRDLDEPRGITKEIAEAREIPEGKMPWDEQRGRVNTVEQTRRADGDKDDD